MLEKKRPTVFESKKRLAHFGSHGPGRWVYSTAARPTLDRLLTLASLSQYRLPRVRSPSPNIVLRNTSVPLCKLGCLGSAFRRQSIHGVRWWRQRVRYSRLSIQFSTNYVTCKRGTSSGMAIQSHQNLSEPPAAMILSRYPLQSVFPVWLGFSC